MLPTYTKAQETTGPIDLKGISDRHLKMVEGTFSSQISTQAWTRAYFFGEDSG